MIVQGFIDKTMHVPSKEDIVINDSNFSNTAMHDTSGLQDHMIEMHEQPEVRTDSLHQIIEL